MTEPATDHRRAIAERNVEAILDAAERLLESGAQASIAAVAKESGVSRVTVYAHFQTREQLLEAVVERAVAHARAALDAAEPEHGPPLEALHRLMHAAWHELDRNHSIAQAAAEQLSPEALRRTHDAANRRIASLVERGRAEGAFRNDLPTAWLVTTLHVLIHAAGDDVRAGRLDSTAALDVLATTIHDVLVGPRPVRL
jgi:TetR/AcrR family transcriptional repressor of mexCD-oprJ operon